MDPRRFMAMALDAGAILRARGFIVDNGQTNGIATKKAPGRSLGCVRLADH